MKVGFVVSTRTIHISCSAYSVTKPESKIGHFAVRSPFGDGITSYGTDSDHAWVAGDTAPIDLSMEFRYEDLPQLAGPIFGRDQKNGPYDIRYFQESSLFETWMEGSIVSPEISYLVKESSFPYGDKLLDDPASFFLPSDEGGWLHNYGPEIFCRITMHVYKVVSGHLPALAGRLNSRAAFHYIRGRYESSRPKLRRMLSCEKN
jgi:hypothetical protein